jgi:phytoene synthase
MAHVLGSRTEHALAAAKDLGIAMQLTNIIRDVGRDLAAGRLYLPLEELERSGLTPVTLRQLYYARQKPDQRFCTLLRSQIVRARYYYTAGLHGVWLLRPDCRLPILLAGRLYQCILSEVENQHYDVLHERARTSLYTKIREACVAFLLDLLWRGGEASIVSEMEMPYER